MEIKRLVDKKDGANLQSDVFLNKQLDPHIMLNI